MPKKRYSIIDKMRVVWQLREKSIQTVSKERGIPVGTIKHWQKNYERIRAEYYVYIHDEAVHRMLLAQLKITKKLDMLIEGMDQKRIDDARLNHLASAVGTLIDRVLRIHNAKDIETPNSHTVRIAYIDERTGAITDAPPWATTHSDEGDPLHSGFLRQTLRQDSPRQNHHHRTGVARQTDVVARPDISDGSASLAGFEDDPLERDWYPD